MIDYKKIKLIVWDLDDTFWKGTLRLRIKRKIGGAMK